MSTNRAIWPNRSQSSNINFMNDVKLPKSLWLWLPLAIMAVQIAVEVLATDTFAAWYISEQGPVELSQSLIMCIGFVVALLTLRKLNPKTQGWLMAWVGIAALACFYITFEELSWGQQILNWDTPEYWTQFNDQNETNLHNTSSWLDQKPRLVLEIGVLVGGLIIPLLIRFKPAWVPQKFAVIYPTNQLVLTAFIAFAVKLSDQTDKFLESVEIFHRDSEVGETYLFLFVLLYLLMLRRRIMQNKG